MTRPSKPTVTMSDLDGSAATRARSRSRLDTLFHDLVAAARPVLFVEGGAYEAAASLRVAAALPDCCVVAFEANPYVHDHFSRTVDYESADVAYLHRALTDTPGEVTFRVVTSSSSLADDRLEGYNSMLTRVGGDWLGDVEYEDVTVASTTLDAEFGLLNGPVALWLDVEGATGPVLVGAPDFLSRCDVAKIEVEETEFWTGQWLARDVVDELARHGIEPVARDIQTDDQYNIVFASARLLERHDVRSRLARYQPDPR